MGVIGTIRNKAGWLIIGIIGFSLAAFILGDLLNNNKSMFSEQSNKIAEIGGESVSPQDFDTRVKRFEDNFKAQTNNEEIDAETMDQLREQTWNQMLNEMILGKEHEKAGVSISPLEFMDMVQGKNIHPQIRQAFSDPKTGEFNKANVIKFLKSMDEDQTGATAEKWLPFETSLKQERLNQKYSNLIKAGLYIPSAFVKQDYVDKNRNAKIKYALFPYNTVSDSSVKISESELKDYYNEHKNEYKQDNSRNIDYVVFDVEPSKEDRAAVEKDITKVNQEFKASSNDSLYLAQNMIKMDMTYYAKEKLSPKIDSLFNSSVGAMIGPYFENNTYKISKLNSSKSFPDSVKARHILLSYEGREKEKVKERVDSIKKQIKSGKPFEALDAQYSIDGSKTKGGDLGWFKEGMMVKPFNDACFSGNKGDMPIVETQFGIHLIEILDLGKTTKKVRIATYEQKLEASSGTYDLAFNKANEFAGRNNTSELFAKSAKDSKLNKRNAEVRENERGIPGLDGSRELVRWSFTSKKGDVSKVYLFGDKYVIGVLNEIREKGIAPMEQIKNELTTAARKEKKGKMLIEKLASEVKALNNLDQIAQKLNLKVQESENVNFTSANVMGVGRELELAGALFTLKVGVLSAPIKGNQGVYLVLPESFTEPAPLKDLGEEKTASERSFKQRADYEVFSALKEKAEIVDNRGKFY